MESVETVEKTVELQRVVQKLEKLEKMINPNSKKSLIMWEEDDSFKKLIATIKEYALTCDVEEFPIELLDKLKALREDALAQITEGTESVKVLKQQAKANLELSELLSAIYVSAMAGNSLEEYEEKLSCEEFSGMKEYLETISHTVPDTEEYVKAEKAIKSKISNLENSVHITIDLERTVSKGGALEYICAEILPAIERLQAEYDAQYATAPEAQEDDDVITALAIRKTLSEKIYDAIIRPIANLFRRKSKVK